jgi:CubicO group peptidase (beta-lactamase class C family)
MRRHKFLLFLFVFVAGCPHLNIAQHSTDQSLENLRKKYEAVGLAVAVVKKGKPVYAKALGLRDVERGELLTMHDMFRIASISKSFSATSVMQLVEVGRLNLSDPVSELIGFKVENPSFPDTPITLQMLLSHTSSLNDTQGYFTLDVIDPATNDSVALCYNSYRPGTDYQYCNLNFNMIGTIIERVSGERFDQYIHKHIIQPLGLSGGFNLDSLDRSRFVTLYEFDKEDRSLKPSPAAYLKSSKAWGNYQLGRSTPLFSPTGGLKISAADLASYMTMHMYLGRYRGKRIISKKSARRMQTPVPNAKGYGLALWTTDRLIPGVEVKGHTGSAYGLYSMMIFNKREKWGMVAITNGCNPVHSNGYVEILASAVNELYADWIRNTSKKTN